MAFSRLITAAALMSAAGYQLATTALHARDDHDLKLKQANLLCVLSALTSVIECAGVLLQQLLQACNVLTFVSVLLLTFNRGATYLVFHDRCQCLHKCSSSLLHKLFFSRCLFTMLCLGQIVHVAVIRFTASGVDEVCAEGMLPGFHRFLICFLFESLLLLQMFPMAAVIQPIYAHYRELEHTTIGRDKILRILTRIGACTLAFVVTDLLTVAMLATSTVDGSDWLPVWVCLSLVVNTATLQCSFHDYGRRFALFSRPLFAAKPTVAEAMLAATGGECGGVKVTAPKKLGPRGDRDLFGGRVMWTYSPIYFEKDQCRCDCLSISGESKRAAVTFV